MPAGSELTEVLFLIIYLGASGVSGRSIRVLLQASDFIRIIAQGFHERCFWCHKYPAYYFASIAVSARRISFFGVRTGISWV